MAKANIPKHKTKSVIESYIEQEEYKLQKEHDQYLSFSFKYLDNNEKFPTYFEDHGYLPTLMQRLIDISTMKRLELIQNNSQSLRCHKILWKDVTEENFGLKNEDQLVDKPYQFQITANAYGRIHGFFINEVFYIRWLDPNHNLYG
tara:strand:+ start:4979 stop:5416 length:438 start_codon:yes stop_codon:yes gene_type:complete